MVPGTCEAGESIKPGAQAPGKRFLKRGAEPAKRATAHLTQGCRPFNGLQRLFFIADPGACAPGFMLPPASQVQRPRICEACFAGSAPAHLRGLLRRFSARAFLRPASQVQRPRIFEACFAGSAPAHCEACFAGYVELFVQSVPRLAPVPTRVRLGVASSISCAGWHVRGPGRGVRVHLLFRSDTLRGNGSSCV
jgi:hypothetical protein